MPTLRKILIADPDPTTVRTLGPALRQRGYQVHAARDGSKALQLAILRYPDLVLLDERAPLIDPRTFVRILRTNPRTERIPVVLTGESDDVDRGRLGSFLRKPFNTDEVLARIDQIFRRVDAARAVSAQDRDIEGNLAQIPLVDLLQVLAMNRKTGRLDLEREGDRAEIALRDGKVVAARAGTVDGEKALYRLLAMREGEFAFVPGTGDTAGSPFARRLDELILEGLRQADEAAQLLSSLPKRNDLVALAVAPEDIPGGLHPVTAEVVALLDRTRSFSEILDRSSSSDLEIMRATLALLEHGYARRLEGPPAPAPAHLLEPHELHALRARIARGRSSGPQSIGKVVVAGGSLGARRNALARFATVPGFAVEPPDPSGFGMLGQLSLGDGVHVDVVALPSDRSFRPLWVPFASGAVGALAILPAEGSEPLLEELSKRLRLAVVACGPREALPAALRDAPGVTFEGSDPAEALRALLARAEKRTC